MLQVFLLVAGLIYSIYGSYVCPPAPPFDPSCIARLIKPGCTSDEDCTKYGTKCCKSDCNVLQCLESVQGIVKIGICPPLPIVKPDFCITAKFSSDCEGNDANCPGQKKCCPTLCGSRNCRDPITEPRKECPAVPVPGPQCFRFDQQCSSDLDCPKSQICCGVICGIGCRDPVVSYLPPAPVSLPREGVCPPPEVVSQDFCNRADVRSDCTAVGRDSECRLAGYKCCPGVCGSLLCQAALTNDRPGCPPINPNLRCITYNQQCNTDDDCGKGKKCCYQPACGTSCYAPDPNCPPYRKDVICKRFDKQCTTNADCKEGDICCSVECGTACKRPYRPPYENPPCQPVLCDLFCEFGFAKDENGCEICRCIQKTCPPRTALCILIPPGACTKENFLIIDGGVKCPLCPSIIPCNKDCLLPVQPGPCKGSFKRYFYDVDTNSCKEFVYGGCQGNNNNFKSLEECEEKCNTKPKGPICPPVCAIFCQFGNVLDSNGCPTCKCKDNPCPPDPLCPRPPQGPPGTCRPPCVFEYEEIDGVRCKVKCGLGPVPPIGPPGVPCPPTNCPIQGPIEPPQPPTGLCVNGNPLPNFFCGRGPSHQECPTGYSCNVDPADRFAVCCPDSICPNGNPLPNIFCGRGPSHQDCPSGYSCNIDPGDAFAVCCPDKKKYGSCPPIKPGTVGPCVELCSGDDSCPGKEKCCSNGCGHACTNPIGEHTCPFVKCAFCEHGYEMDDYGCQTCKCKPDPCPSPVCPPPPEGSCTDNNYRIINGVKCPWCPKIVPCKPKDCPIPDCAQPPPLSCTEPDFRIFEGVKCPWCPKIVPCKANCDAGMPLPDINCGLRPDRQNCPAGFFCNVDPIDRFAVCCPDCDRGKPLSNVRCDDVNRKCPSGYRCKKIHGICCQDCPLIKCSNQCEFGFLNDRNGCPTCDCKPSPCLLPPCARPPPDACTEPQYKIIDGVRCPWCYKIVPCKDKVCPTVPADSICYEYTRDCQDDSSCTDGRKCCRQGCSYVCVNPI